MVKNDKLDALIMLSGDVLIKKNAELYKSTDTSTVERPKSLDRRVRRNINKENRKQEYGALYKYGLRFVAAVLGVCTVSFAAVMSVEALRTALWNAIVKFFDDYISITYVTEKQSPKTLEEIKDIDIGDRDWEKQVMLDSNSMYAVIYKENGTRVLTYTQVLITQNGEWFDNENTVVENVKVAEHSALLMFRVNHQTYSLSWCDGVYEYALDAHSSEISKEELIAIAETIY